ncbi:phosphatase PAP2 family protein [Chitinophaga sp. MM2321]|uniref:phosphatase PAP2 family protein n=1 Tax=Chitinophaga sp. MM2321 TaxID=3137178 RepID=UPI0032D58277
MKKTILFAGLALDALIGSGNVNAQVQATSFTIPVDSVPPPVSSTPAFHSSLTGIIIPAAMVGYGFLALNNHSLRDLNHTTGAELKEDHPNFRTHIDNYLQYSPVAAVYILNASGVHGKHNFRDRTIILGISALLTAGSVEGVKHLTHEVRPDGSDDLSFPSGHTATAFASAEFLRQEYKDVSPWYGVGGYAAAAATGALRMYNNKHWLSDVVAGAGFGILSTKAAYWVYPWIRQTLFKDQHTKMATVLLPYYDAQWHSAGLSIVLLQK